MAETLSNEEKRARILGQMATLLGISLEEVLEINLPTRSGKQNCPSCGKSLLITLKVDS